MLNIKNYQSKHLIHCYNNANFTMFLSKDNFSTRTLTSQGIGFLETLKNPANLFKNNLNNIRNNAKSQI